MTIIDYRDFTERGYLAPTVYLKQGQTLSRWNYYGSKETAIAQYWYLSGKSTTRQDPIGTKTFLTNGSAQTFGINVDFYGLVNGSFQPISYAYLKANFNSIGNHTIFRFYTTAGDGIYWAILNTTYFALSATITDSEDPAKIQALDKFYREVQLLKYRYNSLAGMLNEMAKRQLNTKEQQIFNQGVLLLNNLREEVKGIKGIDITFTSSGAIALPVFLIIGIILILAAATAWTVSVIITEGEKTARINATYELNKWIALQRTELARMRTAGEITPAQESDINKTLDNAAAVGNEVAKNSSKPSGSFLQDIEGIVKWGVLGIVAVGIISVLNKNKNGTTSV